MNEIYNNNPTSQDSHCEHFGLEHVDLYSLDLTVLIFFFLLFCLIWCIVYNDIFLMSLKLICKHGFKTFYCGNLKAYQI